MGGGQAEDANSAFGGPLALRRKFYATKDRSGAFSCMLWCTIALGAMTSNMNSRLVSLKRTALSYEREEMIRNLKLGYFRGCSGSVYVIMFL